MKLQNSLVGTKAFIKDSLRQCARLVKAFGTKLIREHIIGIVMVSERDFNNVTCV